MNDKRRHVLFLIPTLAGGGAERVIVTLARHVDRSRFRLTLAVLDLRGAVFRDDIPADVELVDLNAGRVRYALPKIIALVWRVRPDVLFSTLGHLNLALAIVRLLLPRRVRTVARETIVVSSAIQQHRYRLIWTALYRCFYRRHDRVVCQSQDMYDDLVRRFRLPHDKAIVIHNPVDVERIRTLAGRSAALPAVPLGATILIAAGRLVHQKGFDLLIEALVLLNEPSTHLLLLGSGPLEGELRRIVAENGFADRIHFVGFQANPYAWFARADAFVLSSRYEGFPNVVLEALACGTPVIATPAPGGTEEILSGVEGCVVAESITAQGLAHAIGLWLKGPRQKVPDSVLNPYRLECIIGKYETILSETHNANRVGLDVPVGARRA